MLIPFSKITKKYNMKIHGILHIGAHNCEELGTYNKYGLKNSQIIWVEANPKLVEQNLRVDKSRIIKNFICCDTDQGKTKLNIANNGQSSSILELGTHAKSYPSIKYNDFVEVNNSRIDTMYNEDKIPKNFANFLNIDIQGAELMALKGMGDLLNYFDYVYLEVNKDYVYKNCALVHEIDQYLSKYNYVRVETSWTNAQWGDALYIRIKNNFDLLKNVRCSEEIWQIKGITLEEALEKANSDPRVKALHWYKNNGGDGRIGGVEGWYQGAGGFLGKIVNNDWDTIVLKSKTLVFDIGANIGRWTDANLNKYDKIITIEASPYTFEKLKKKCKNRKVNLLNYAICDNNGKDIKFYHADADVLSTLNKDWLTDSKSRFFNHKYKEIICKTKTIDDLIMQYGIPNLIKIDVEGGEYKCIKSLTQKVDRLCFEWASETNDITYKCLNYLFTLGFTKFYIQMADNYTFYPNYNNFEDLSSVKSKLSKMIIKKDWGMIWCI